MSKEAPGFSVTPDLPITFCHDLGTRLQINKQVADLIQVNISSWYVDKTHFLELRISNDLQAKRKSITGLSKRRRRLSNNKEQAPRPQTDEHTNLINDILSDESYFFHVASNHSAHDTLPRHVSSIKKRRVDEDGFDDASGISQHD